MGFYVFESVSRTRRGDAVCTATWTNIVRGADRCEPSDADPRAEGHAGQVPDRTATRAPPATSTRSTSTRSSPRRSACPAASCTGCGRWPRSRARRPRPAAGPESLKRLSVQFRGMGQPEQEIVVTGTVREVDDGVAHRRRRGRAGRQPDHPQRRGRAGRRDRRLRRRPIA